MTSAVSNTHDSDYRFINIQREGAIEWLSLNRPDSFNSLNVGLPDELYNYFGQLPDRQDVRVVVLRGSGKHFCAGYDLDDVDKLTASVEQALRMQRRLSEVIVRMRRCPQPVLGSLNRRRCAACLRILRPTTLAGGRVPADQMRTNVV